MRKLFFLLVALFMTGSSLFAQRDSEYPIIEEHKGAIGYSISYDNYNIDFVNSNWEGKTNFSGGFYFKRTIKTNLEIRLGLFAAERGYNHTQVINQFVTFEYNIWAIYMDLSAAIGYRYVLNKRFVFVPSGGFMRGIPIAYVVASADVDPEDGVTEYLTGSFQSTNALSVQLGLEIHLGRRFMIQIEPYYRKWFSPFNTTAMETAPTSYGISSGLFVKF